MSSEAITRNDLTAILNGVLPPTPSEYRKLLWTNPSPTSSFAAQTISLDLSEYDSVELEMNMYTSGTTLNLQTFKGDVGTDLILSADAHTNSVTVTRLCTISSTGIYFGSGYAGTANDQAVIPIKIYGIKYERVQPPVLDAEVEPLATGATLYRIGRMRMLVLTDFAYGTTIQRLASTDRPSYMATGVGSRHNGGTYVTMARMEVDTNGNVAFYNVGYYNTTSGYTVVVSGDIFNITAIWYVAE